MASEIEATMQKAISPRRLAKAIGAKRRPLTLYPRIRFKLNVIQRSSRAACFFYWAGATITFATIFRWGWWRI